MYYVINKTILIPEITIFSDKYDALQLLYNLKESTDCYVVFKNNNINDHIYIKKYNKIYKITNDKQITEVKMDFKQEFNLDISSIYNKINNDQLDIVFKEKNNDKINIIEKTNNTKKEVLSDNTEENEIKKKIKEQTDEILKLYKAELDNYKFIEQKLKNIEKEEEHQNIRNLCIARDDYKIYKQLKKDNVSDNNKSLFFIEKYYIIDKFDKETIDTLESMGNILYETMMYKDVEDKHKQIAIKYNNMVKNIKVDIVTTSNIAQLLLD